MSSHQKKNFRNKPEVNNEEFGSLTIEGRNAVIEAIRSGKSIDKILVLDGCQDGPVATIRKEAKKAGIMLKFVSRDRLDQISETGAHQGVIAYAAAYDYSEMEDIFNLAEERGEPPFVLILDNIEDPHNLGAIVRTANIAGAHGVIIPKNRAVGLTATVAKTSAGALNYTPVVKVTNIARTIDELKDRGMWFVCADMDGSLMYDLDLKGSIGLVIGNEGSGVSKLVREKCDMVASIPMKGQINSLNASVAAGVLAYEIVRQRGYK
jgi:23S rRNA (guanosine2251-2'-O)-methyltransferase